MLWIYARPCIGIGIGIRYPPRHSLLYFRALRLFPFLARPLRAKLPISDSPICLYLYLQDCPCYLPLLLLRSTIPFDLTPARVPHASSDPLVKQQIRTPVPTTYRTHKPATPRLFLAHDHLFSRYRRHGLVVKVQPPAGTLHSNSVMPTAGCGAVVVHHTEQAISDRLSGALGG
jgi:hypothetical protein